MKRITTKQYRGAMKAAKPSKYLNRKVELDGIKFDSKKEADRWQELRILEREGQIVDLRRQIKRQLRVNGALICSYVSDFEYQTMPDLDQIIEDVKSPFTRLKRDYRIKKKLFEALFAPMTITEV